MMIPPFVAALRGSETKKGRPTKMTDRPTVKVYGDDVTACLMLLNGGYHLLSLLRVWAARTSGGLSGIYAGCDEWGSLR